MKSLGVAGMLGDVGNAAKPAAEQQAAAEPPAKAAEAQPEVTILNPSTPKAKADTAKKADAAKPGTAKTAEKGAEIQTASVAATATQIEDACGVQGRQMQGVDCQLRRPACHHHQGSH